KSEQDGSGRSSGNAVFGTDGTIPFRKIDGGTVLGGYTPASSNESISYGIGAVFGTSIDTNGDTTTYSAIRGSNTTAATMEDMYVEQTFGALVTCKVTYAQGEEAATNADRAPIVLYERNKGNTNYPI